MYTLTTANLFRLDEFDDGDASESPAPPEEEEEGEEWPPFRKTGSFDPYSDDPRLAVQKLEFCTRSHTLLVAARRVQIVGVRLQEDADTWKDDRGFQPQLVVQLMPPATCTSMTIHSTGISANGWDQSMTRRGGKIVQEVAEGVFFGGCDEADRKCSRRRKWRWRPDYKGNAHVLEIEDTRPVDGRLKPVLSTTKWHPWFGTWSVRRHSGRHHSGSVFIYTLVLPLAENRKEEDVHASLSKEIQLRHHAPVVHISVVIHTGLRLRRRRRPRTLAAMETCKKS
ncbi:hypothetical protein BV898_00654 [Hypsibius exemplaris]|uniref:Uncharacterized protein n=1 Tax=Hypsibius exemplaris TaxID=2072580 RepID=A0A1W0XE28_HYPEX|nr:hypothetical protein BV898_00654 [Hypsibius exemplaris]